MKRTPPVEGWHNPARAEHKAKEAQARIFYAESSLAEREDAAFLAGRPDALISFCRHSSAYSAEPDIRVRDLMSDGVYPADLRRFPDLVALQKAWR